jgi:hypothetical protein
MQVKDSMRFLVAALAVSAVSLEVLVGCSGSTGIPQRIFATPSPTPSASAAATASPTPTPHPTPSSLRLGERQPDAECYAERRADGHSNAHGDTGWADADADADAAPPRHPS